MSDLISRQAAIELIRTLYPSAPIMRMNRKRWEEKYEPYIEAEKALEKLPSIQPEEVIPHRNYKYLSDYWCECGWHLGKKGEVKYCSDCGRKVNWDG